MNGVLVFSKIETSEIKEEMLIYKFSKSELKIFRSKGRMRCIFDTCIFVNPKSSYETIFLLDFNSR